ncbi:EpsG family protein [Vibrio fluvialis]|nr:EpsG family protein [Vibrio fluvialis]
MIKRSNQANNLILLFLLITISILSFYIGNRGVVNYTDFQAYNLWYERVLISNDFEGRLEPLFQYLGVLSSLLGLSPGTFFSLLYLLFNIMFYSVCVETSDFFNESNQRVDYNFKYIFFYVSFIVSLILPFYLNATENIIRAGLCFPFILKSLLKFEKKKQGLFVFYALLAIGLHYSSIIFLSFYIMFKLVSDKWLNYSLIFSIFLYAFSSTKSFLQMLGLDIINEVIDRVDNFVSYANYDSGYRLDFLFFTLSGLLFYRFSIVIFKLNFNKEIENIYKIFTLPFLIVGFGSFSDRYLVNAWLLYPLLVSLPLSAYICIYPNKKLSDYLVYILPILVFLLLIHGFVRIGAI